MKALSVAFLAFLGMIDTLYLILSQLSGPPPCHIVLGCEEVLTSVYSQFVGIPLSWFGLVFYVVVFGAAVFEASGNARTIHLLTWPSTIAFITSVVLTGIQMFVLEAYCEYCLASAALSTAIFLVVLLNARSMAVRY